MSTGGRKVVNNGQNLVNVVKERHLILMTRDRTKKFRREVILSNVM